MKTTQMNKTQLVKFLASIPGLARVETDNQARVRVYATKKKTQTEELVISADFDEDNQTWHVQAAHGLIGQI
jgi:hypothetical protein